VLMAHCHIAEHMHTRTIVSFTVDPGGPNDTQWSRSALWRGQSVVASRLATAAPMALDVYADLLPDNLDAVAMALDQAVSAQTLPT
jgi:hypothetical protein